MDKLLGALSLCRKAGKLRLGGDVVRQEARTGGAKLVLLTSDVAERSARQTAAACQEGKVPLRRLPLDMGELSRVAGKEYGILAVCDAGFARMITGLLPSQKPEDTP